ncbi:MAG TPA: YceI family protein [Albitalea sp.]|nr:YceI family protein [Albitalea sp.]
MRNQLLALAACSTVAVATAAPVTYKIDPDHTYPSFEADHMGISVWRGKLNKSRGTVTLDKTDGSGSLDVSVDLASIDFGLDALNRWARGPEFFNTKKFPRATFKGRFDGAVDGGMPAQAVGELTLHGVTRPVALKINALKCVPHPLFKRELCGADAVATLQRDDFGLEAGKEYGFKMDVTLHIQVEALAAP